ncbi:25S rRNA (cytosine-C(5))-methyltransferase NSUN5 isoform X2 [Phragmites australis]|uniref:25S rRNA (cytosine-C(5))-methyltransferase NSUN5 isoform X2 n=1 Tax=Phragmites australis TaxID=29695 RepID=UPI002D78CE60|nr:25S rRNA (cytosine-C(5))-methyltransferase NSUN5 isoform X2 [Phragmites australis]
MPPPQPKNRSRGSAATGVNRPPPRRMASRDAAERAAFFARREAAAVLRRVLHGDAARRAAGSIKSLVYSPTVRNKRATFALVCQTLKYLPILKEVLTSCAVLNSKWKQVELVYVTAYDILFGQGITVSGSAEQLIMLHKDSLRTALDKVCARRKVSCVEDLLSEKTAVKPKPRSLRVNTLKTTTESVIEELNKIHMVDKDDIVPDMLVLPPGTDLHNHPLVTDGKVFLQGKASCMVAVALCPKPGWKVIDACAAPGNKTVHLAALMNGEGSIIACELNKERAKTLQHTVRRSGANNIQTVTGDFLDIDSNDPSYAEVRAILLDPSCSGSGISTERLDYLLPSHSRDHQDDASTSWRIQKLSAFQRKALTHALLFPSVERVVYSTCSIHQAENEDVVNSILPLATSLGFELATPFPQWRRRGLPVFEGSEHLLRTDPEDDMEGFFIALFVRKAVGGLVSPSEDDAVGLRRKQFHRRGNRLRALSSLRLSRMILCPTGRL